MAESGHTLESLAKNVPDRLDVTDEFLRYAQPLIGDGWPAIAIENGLQRFPG